MTRKRPVLCAVLLAACGPSVADIGDDTTSGTTAVPDDDGDDDAPATTQPGTTMPGTATSASTTGMTTVADTGPLPTTESADSLDSISFFDDGFGDWGNSPIECDIWAQDCPRGEKCVPWANDGGIDWNATRCAPIERAPSEPGEPCTVVGDPFSGFDSCAAGSVCWGADSETLTGVCYAQCTGSEASPQCVEGLECWDGVEQVLAVCVDTCLPLAPTCAEHESFVLDAATESAFCIPTPLVMGTQYGETCDVDALACGTGLACGPAVNVPSCLDECCTTLCDITDMTECPDAASGQQCLPLFDRAPPGFENVGICGIPQ